MAAVMAHRFAIADAAAYARGRRGADVAPAAPEPIEEKP